MNTSTITNIQKNGLDLVFKYIKKTNPFVVSYRISKDNKDSYRYSLYLEYGVDYEILRQMYNQEWASESHKKDYYDNTMKDYSFIGNPFYPRHLNTKSEEYDKYFNAFFYLKKNIEVEMNEFYREIPDEKQIFVIRDKYYNDIEPFNLVTLSIDNFYLDKKVNK